MHFILPTRNAVEKAIADGEIRDVALISKAAVEGSWQAAAWRLERRFPDRWGRRDRHQVDANVKSTVKVSPDDAVQELTRVLATRATGGSAGEAPRAGDLAGLLLVKARRRRRRA